MDAALIVPAIDTSALLGPVRRALGSATVEIVDWQVDTLQPAAPGANGAVYRVWGNGRDHGMPLPWSLVLKVLSPPGKSEPPSLADFHDGDPATDPASLLYWKREALAYHAGVLADLPGGLRAPCYFGMQERADDELWLWLETIVDVSEPRWSLAQYERAAHTLGRFNGAYLVGRPIPTAAWLSTGWLHGFAARAAPAVARLPSLLEHRLVGRWLRPDNAASLLRLWNERETLLAALDQLPRTFCHYDAWRGNLFATCTPDRHDRLVAIDWAAVGDGAVGVDAGVLVGVAVIFDLVDPPRREELDALAFAAYMQGLRGAGWNGDPRVARLGYTAAMALKIVIGYLPGLLWNLLDESSYAAYKQHSGSSVETFADNRADSTRWLLDRGEEALDLLGQL